MQRVLISGTLKLNLGQVSATNSFLIEKNKPSGRIHRGGSKND